MPPAANPTHLPKQPPGQPPGQRLEQLSEQLLEQAIAAGAQTAEVYQSSSLERPVIFEGNRLKQVETTQAEGVALRLWKDGKPGLAVGYGPVEPALLVEKALAISALNEPENANLSTGGQRDFGTVGQTVETPQLVDWGKAAIAQIREQFPEAICEADFTCETETTRLINSHGLDYRSQDSSISSSISAELTQNNDFLCVSDGHLSRDAHQMTAQIAEVTASIIQRLHWAEKTVQPVTGQRPVIFTPAAADLLWDTLYAALSGKRVKEGISPWSGQLGQPVIDPAITLRQDPHFGPYSCHFDDEGVLTQPLTLIEAGQITSWYCDRATGPSSTGNGIRPSLGSYPTPGLINLIVEAGNKNWPSLLAEHSEAIIVDQVLGEGGDITGDLSVNLDLGYLVSQGEIVGRVKDTMVTGNAYTALNHLIALGDSRQWNGATYTPAVVAGSLNIVG